jgi:hypothetical protein
VRAAFADGDNKGTSFPRATRDADRAALQPHEFLHQREPDSTALVCAAVQANASMASSDISLSESASVIRAGNSRRGSRRCPAINPSVVATTAVNTPPMAATSTRTGLKEK